LFLTARSSEIGAGFATALLVRVPMDGYAACRTQFLPFCF